MTEAKVEVKFHVGGRVFNTRTEAEMFKTDRMAIRNEVAIAAVCLRRRSWCEDHSSYKEYIIDEIASRLLDAKAARY